MTTRNWLAVLAVSLSLAPTLLGQASAQIGEREAVDRTAAVFRSAHFEEPLVKVAATSTAEDDALLGVINAYNKRTDLADLSALTAFLAAYPKSGWSPALWTNLGLTYFHNGYFSRALDAWRKAWVGGKDATDPSARALVDRAVGELARLTAALGRNDDLANLLKEVEGRNVSGPATESIQVATETLQRSKKDPRHLYICGPLALEALLKSRGAISAQTDFLRWYKASSKGTSLAEVGQLADKAKLDHKLILRKPGQPVPVPSVVHWKVGHFSAIVGEANGRYRVKDPVFANQDLWVRKAAIDEEATGYFLVPTDTPNQNTGWAQVTNSTAKKIWGKGPTNQTQPGGAGPDQDPQANPPPCGNCPCGGMCGYNIGESSVSVTLQDSPVGYSPPIGPSAKTQITYNQREDSQPANFSFFNISAKWTLNWLSYVTDDPTNPGANVSRYIAGGGAYYYTGYQSSTGRFTAQNNDGSILVRATSSPISYRRQLGDGSVEIYAQSNGAPSYPRRIFLSQIIDPQGNALTLNYDVQERLVSIIDAVGRTTTFTYGVAAKPLLITQITDPFGRSATLTYDASYRLSSITDVIGLTSSFSYDANSLVNVLTTPYGTTNFAYTAPGTSSPPRYVEVTDPLGYHEREEWLEPAPISGSDPSSTIPQGMPVPVTNNYLQYRESFHWDKIAYVQAGCTPTGGCDYTKARSRQFGHNPNNISVKSTSIANVKYPLENRIWFNYPGQTETIYEGTFEKPTATGRVLDDSTTQLSQSSYDTAGYFKLTQAIDPLGRTTSFTYSNHIDLAAVSQTTEFGNQTTIAQFIYNTRHRPIFYTDAAGQTTSYTYNAAGQMLSQTNALGQTTTYQYNTSGDLTSVTNANNVVAASYTYDSYDRVRTFTDSEGWTATYDYDAADRITKVTYPDGTFDTYIYDKLDLASYRDRLGRLWTYTHDANRRLTATTDPLGHQTLFGYNGINGLTSLTDPKSNVTSWDYDIQGRLTLKTYPDNSTVTYTYETTTSRLKSVLDALGQTKQYAYAQDNRLSGITYLNAVNTTPNVTYAYDPHFPRVVSMTDGTGTSQYSYIAAGSLGALQLQQETSGLANSAINYAYDELGRLASRTVTGAGAETFGYDTIGRLTAHASDLGSFTLGYLGQTSQITSRQLASSTLETTWGYLPNAGDRRLASINNTGLSVGQYSNFTFATTPENFITSIGESTDTSVAYPSASTQSASYNNLNQLTNLSGQTLTYDAVGNLTSDGQRTYSWDAENRLIGISYPAEPGKQTAFAYDGLSRRTTITSTPAAGSPVATSYIWCGTGICQARNAGNAATRNYYSEGELASGSPSQPYYYGPDQIGSVRRAFASTSSAPAYSYDPYGNALQTTAPATDFAYARMFFSADSGLYLTQYRAYDAVAARWLSRDPVGESSDSVANLYRYVLDNPVSLNDPLGLQPPSGVPYPSNVPGGPWTWSPNPQNSRGGQYIGPSPPGGGPRITCTYAPPSPINPDPYWKVYTPSSTPGQPAEQQRYNMSGVPISSEQAHPGTSASSIVPSIVRTTSPIGLFLGTVLYSTPAY